MKLPRCATLFLACASTLGQADELFPLVPSDIEAALFARDPLVRNPCAIAFDHKGRLCVGLGPQYRNPRPDTSGDSIFFLLDTNNDGAADVRKEFATGFNAIQGLAWRGRDLWVANSPDLTVVSDLDGDDVADEYIRLYTDLGNLEHGLHGLNWAPDGLLYMSKGNSKGLTQPPDRLAPRAFRELWGVDRPELPDLPAPRRFKKGEYQKNYHDPDDDWGREGGVLRCDANGEKLEVVSRGFRNPWDITFDDTFTWLGTDNDQVLGDKIFSPFYGAHFGWGHSWSFDWNGEDHLPTAPPNGPLFEGSGTGVIFCGLARYPEKYRNVFFVNDWLRREVYLYQPIWKGARLLPAKPSFDLLAWAGTGRSLARSAGRQFDPVDIEIGPDEAIYISSWGRDYGATYDADQMKNEGRIYRFWPKSAPPIRPLLAKQSRAIESWSFEELITDLSSHLPVWRVNAQEELIRRGDKSKLSALLFETNPPRSLQTWAAWTLGRMDRNDSTLDALFTQSALSITNSLNARIQSIRILAHRKQLPDTLVSLLESAEPRLRFETLLAIRQTASRQSNSKIIDLTARETDRLVYYAAWGAMRALLPQPERKTLLTDRRPGVRRAALLGLLEEDALDNQTLSALTKDSDPHTASLAQQRINGKAEMVIRGRPLVTPPLSRPAPIANNRKEPVTVSQVLTLLPKSDASRGQELFLGHQGAGCISCHRLAGMGNSFAPDLAEIGRRADPEFIVRSIIEPSATITQGFVTHTIGTGPDEEFSGILLEETGLAVKLALTTGETVTLPRKLIRKHETSTLSAMPSNYGELLSAQQIADIAAFLGNQRGSNSASAPASSDASAQVSFKIRRDAGQFEIMDHTNSLATFIYQHPELTRPALANLRTRAGTLVTRQFPAPANADHRWMHPGICISFGDLDGNDYWRFKAKVEHAGFLREPAVQPHQITWSVRNRYLSEQGTNTVCLEESSYTFGVDAAGLLLQIDTSFFNDERDFYFGDQEESGLCIRIADQLRVKGGSGTILNDEGAQNEAGTWGHDFEWIDYSGAIEHGRAGLLIVPHPDNPRKSWSHSRDYGVLVANPFPRQPESRREAYVKTWVKKGARHRLRYSVLIY